MRYPQDMDPKTPSDRIALAPPADGGAVSMRLPSREPSWPRVDEHLVEPETREEMVRGHRVVALPANAPHGEQHFRLDYVLGAQVADGYVGATDLLTRAGSGSNFATDTCIRREGIDPSTGVRWLEELAFEVVAEQSMRNITERAEDLAARGVRRIVAIFVNTGEVREWSREEGRWRVLDLDEDFVDPTLQRPLKVRVLLDNAAADDAVVDALKDKGNRRIAELEAQSEAMGKAEGFRQSIEQVCVTQGIPFGAEQRAQLESLDVSALEAMLQRVLTERRWP
ncbi:MAG: hypothetical protein AAGF11_26140 [Myxococcota bacterium]